MSLGFQVVQASFLSCARIPWRRRLDLITRYPAAPPWPLCLCREGERVYMLGRSELTLKTVHRYDPGFDSSGVTQPSSSSYVPYSNGFPHSSYSPAPTSSSFSYTLTSTDGRPRIPSMFVSPRLATPLFLRRLAAKPQLSTAPLRISEANS